MSRSYFVISIIALFFLGCTVDENREIADSELEFSTTDDSELFFVNVRQLYYDLEEIEAAKMKVYRIKGRPESDQIILFPTIVWNWMYDEAYIIFEGNVELDTNTKLLWINNGDSGSVIYSGGDKMEQLKLATFIYNGLKKNYNFKLNTGEKEIPFLVDKKEREAFRITMADYYRLVNVL